MDLGIRRASPSQDSLSGSFAGLREKASSKLQTGQGKLKRVLTLSASLIITLSAENSMKKFLSAMIVTSALSGGPAAGQAIHLTDIAQSSPSVERSEEGYAGCGIRVMVADLDKSLFHDFTLRIAWKTPFGLLDVRSFKSPKGKAKEGEPVMVTPRPERFWIVKETDAKALRPDRMGNHTSPGVLIGPLPLMETMQAIIDIMAGRRMHVAVGYPGQHKDEDRTLSFQAPLTKENSKSLAACLLVMNESIAAEAKAKSGGKNN